MHQKRVNDRSARDRLIDILDIDQERLESLRIEISDRIVERYLGGMKGLLGKSSRKDYQGVSWRAFHQVVIGLKSQGREPIVQNIVRHLGPQYHRTRYKPLGKRVKLAEPRPQKGVFPVGKITVYQGGGVGVQASTVVGAEVQASGFNPNKTKFT